MEWNLAMRTVELGERYASQGRDLNNYEWSQQQRYWLRGNQLDIDILKEETSIYQIRAKTALGCATSLLCLRNLAGIGDADIRRRFLP